MTLCLISEIKSLTDETGKESLERANYGENVSC